MTEGRTIAAARRRWLPWSGPSTPRRSTPWFSWATTLTGGPDSRGVLEQMIALAERCTVVPLLGNHEEMLLEC